MYAFDSRIRYSETDSEGYLTLDALLNYFQDCSTFHSEDVGLGIGYMKEIGQVWVLSSWQIVVKKHHLDTNHHVNNGQYVNIAMEYLPDDFVIRQMRAEYKKQAFLDDVLHPYVVSTENDYVICLQDEAGKPYVSVEFQGQ